MVASLLLFFKGFLMGAADVVPGVSGGTIAFITGIYQRLLSNISFINLQWLKLFFTHPLQAVQKIDLLFLAIVFAGILVSVKTLAGVIVYALENRSIVTWSFFNGLILSSAVIILVKEFLKDKNLIKSKKIFLLFFFCLVGIFFGYWVSSLSIVNSGVNLSANLGVNSSPSFLGVFFAGLIAISAMILPGISGSFLLIVMGKYQIIMNAIKNLDFAVLFPFAVGCVLGILAMSKIVSLLLQKYYLQTIFFLVGLMLGCLKKIFPWKVEEQNVLPNIFENINGTGSSQFLLAIVFCFLGGIISICLFQLERFKKKK